MCTSLYFDISSLGVIKTNSGKKEQAKLSYCPSAAFNQIIAPEFGARQLTLYAFKPAINLLLC